LLKRFDKDGDGKLSEAEKAEAKKAMEERKGGSRGKGAPSGDREERMLKRFDKDGDGKLSEAERPKPRRPWRLVEAQRAKVALAKKGCSSGSIRTATASSANPKKPKPRRPWKLGGAPRARVDPAAIARS